MGLARTHLYPSAWLWVQTMSDLTPAQVGRMRALQRLAEGALDLAALNDPAGRQQPLSDDDRAYLAAYADTCRSVAQRLRTSPGASQ